MNLVNWQNIVTFDNEIVGVREKKSFSVRLHYL